MSFFKKKQDIAKGAYSKGQATIEYVLLLVVIITIALGIGGPLGRHLTKFSGAMVGPEGYYACLTRHGVLPGNSYTSFAGVNCGQLHSQALGELGKIENSNFGPGTGLGGGEFNSSSRTDTSGAVTQGGGGNRASGDDSRNKTPRASRHRVKKSPSKKSGGQAVNQESFPVSFADDKGGTKKRKGAKRYSVEGDDQISGFKKKKKKYKNADNKSRIKIEKGYLGDQIEGREDKDSTAFRVESDAKRSTGKTGEDSKKGGKLQVRKPTGDSELDDKTKKMSFGGFLKYLIIAILIIVVLAMAFSQIMEYQSRE